MEPLVLFFCFVFFKSTKTEEIEVDWFVAAFCGLHCSGSEGVQICSERDSPLLSFSPLLHSSPASRQPTTATSASRRTGQVGGHAAHNAGGLASKLWGENQAQHPGQPFTPVSGGGFGGGEVGGGGQRERQISRVAKVTISRGGSSEGETLG